MPTSRISLEQLKIVEPCHEDWNAMTGNAQRRFCAACQKHVHDVSEMTRDAAEQLVCNSAGNLCLRLTHDADGRVMTLETTRRQSFRWNFRAIVATLFAGVTALNSGGCITGMVVARSKEQESQAVHRTAGMISLPARATMPSTNPAVVGEQGSSEK